MKRSTSSDLLPAACLLAIFAGFFAYVFLSEHLVLCLISAGVGAVIGILIANDGTSDKGETQDHRYSANSSTRF